MPSRVIQLDILLSRILSVLLSSLQKPVICLYEIGCNGADGWIDITVTGGSETEPYGYLLERINNPALCEYNGRSSAIKAGVYRVYVTDANGCMTDRGLSLSEPLPLDLSLSVSDITCLTAPAYNDGAIDLTVTGGKNPYGYAWTGPSGYTAGSSGYLRPD